MVSKKNFTIYLNLQATLDAQSMKPPGLPISRKKLNILKESAILTFKDYSRMKNSNYLPSLTTINTLSKSSLSPDLKTDIDINKALEHKIRMIN